MIVLSTAHLSIHMTKERNQHRCSTAHRRANCAACQNPRSGQGQALCRQASGPWRGEATYLAGRDPPGAVTARPLVATCQYWERPCSGHENPSHTRMRPTTTPLSDCPPPVVKERVMTTWVSTGTGGGRGEGGPPRHRLPLPAALPGVGLAGARGGRGQGDLAAAIVATPVTIGRQRRGLSKHFTFSILDAGNQA